MFLKSLKSLLIGLLIFSCASNLIAMERPEQSKTTATASQLCDQWKGSYLHQLPKDMRDQLARYLTKMEYGQALHHWLYKSRKIGKQSDLNQISYKWGLRFDPTYRYLVAYDRYDSNEIEIINYNKGDCKEIKYIKAPAGIRSLSMDKEGKYLYLITWDCGLELYELATGRHLSSDLMSEQYRFVRFNPAIADQVALIHDRWIELYRLQEDYSLEKIIDFSDANGHSAEITRCVFNKQGTRLATVSKDKTIRVWDTKSGNILIFTTPDFADAAGIFFQDNNLFIERKNQIQILDMNTRKWQIKRITDVYSCILDPNGLKIVIDKPDCSLLLDNDFKLIAKLSKYYEDSLFAFFDATGDHIFVMQGPAFRAAAWCRKKISDPRAREFLFNKASLEQVQFIYRVWLYAQEEIVFDFDLQENKAIFDALPDYMQELLKDEFRSFEEKSLNAMKVVCKKLIFNKWI